MPLTRSWVLFAIIFLGLMNLHSAVTSAKKEEECSVLLGILEQSNFSTNCNCKQLSSQFVSCKDNCSQEHHFVGCTGRFITELYLSNLSLNGNMKWVGAFEKLTYLDVSLNNMNGSIPSTIWSLANLIHLNISSNKLNGHIKYNFSNSNQFPLEALDLSSNQIKGPFPHNFCTRFPNLTKVIISSNSISSANLSMCEKLEQLDASFNRLQGFLLEDIKRKSSLRAIDLKSNRLNGSVPSLKVLVNLNSLDLSFNNLSGNFGENQELGSNMSKLNVSHNNLQVNLSAFMINKFGLSAFWPNSACTQCFPPPQSPSPSPSPSMAAGAGDRPLRSRVELRVAAIAGIALGATVGTLLIIAALSLVLIRKRRPKMTWAISKPPPKHVPEIGPFSFEAHSGTWVADVQDPTAVGVVIFEKPLLNLTFSDLLQATASFDRESEVGDGSGLVYKCVLPGVLENEAKVAIKVLEEGRHLGVEEAEKSFTAMGKIKHENLVPLLGYCIVGEEKLLIYKHIEGGSLEDVLHEVPEGGLLEPTEDWSNMDSWDDRERIGQDQCVIKISKLIWQDRVKVALGIARALAYLHNGCSQPIIHGALSSTCILLDAGNEGRLANYGGGWGLRRQLTPGYVAPEYCNGPQHHRNATVKSDVYSMGVVLLELATGRRALGNYAAGCSNLVAWVRLLTKEKREVRAVDPSLPEGTHVHVVDVIKMAYLCTADSAAKRPSMQQVVGLLKDLAPNS